MPCSGEGEVVIALARLEDASGRLGVWSYKVMGPYALVCMEDTEQTCLGIDPGEGTSGIQIGFCRIRYC